MSYFFILSSMLLALPHQSGSSQAGVVQVLESDELGEADIHASGELHRLEGKQTVLLTVDGEIERPPSSIVRRADLDNSDQRWQVSSDGFVQEGELDVHHHHHYGASAGDVEAHRIESDQNQAAFLEDMPKDEEFVQKQDEEPKDSKGSLETKEQEGAPTEVVQVPLELKAVHQSHWVTCGGHKAPSCQKCTTTNATGHATFDKKADFCHGDCHWNHTLETCVDAVPDTPQAVSDGPHKTSTSVPDLLDPRITAKDVEVIEHAAEEAIDQENKEMAEAHMKETLGKEAEVDVHRDSPTRGKSVWFVLTIIFSIILGICAIASCAALLVFGLWHPPSKGDGLMEHDANAEDYGEEHDVATAGQGMF